MRILAVDTTGAHGSVALLRDGELEGLLGFGTGRPRHAERLLPDIHALLDRLGLTTEAVDAFAVAAGPGSFTGLRIGISTTAGLSFATGKPAVTVSALEAVGYRFRRLEGLVVAMLEAYRGEVYGAAYRRSGESIAEIVSPRCELPEAFLDALPEPPLVVGGSGLIRHESVVVSRFGPGVVANRSFFFAEEVARLGESLLRAGKGKTSGELEALYIRPSEAERNRDREVPTG